MPQGEGVPSHPKKPPLPFNPPSDPSTRDSSPAKVSFAGPDFLSPTSAGGSRRGSKQSYDPDSRRGSVKEMATDVVKDLKKGVRKVTDSTVEAGHKVKDKTAEVSTSVKSATKDAGKWVAQKSSKKAKKAMEQAKSHLSFGEKFTLFAADKIKALSRRGMTHVLMLFVVIIYTAIGAAIFMVVEGGATGEDVNMEIVKKNISDTLFEYAANQPQPMDEAEFYTVARAQLERFAEKHYEFRKQEANPNEDKHDDWTFWKAMFFCSTITTTIGYGNVAPQEDLGRIIAILYALIGIPLFLIVMADFGKLFTRLLKQLFILWFKLVRTEQCKRFMSHYLVQRVLGRLEIISDFLSCSSEEDEEEKNKPKNPEDYFVDGNFNVPVSLALGILIIYILIGSFVFALWEKWPTFLAFYFIFVSMTTIGFGDVVPKHPGFMMAATIYLVFGLAFTAMSINVIQEKLTDTFKKASVKMKESFKTIMGAAGHTEDDSDSDDDVKGHGNKNGAPNIVVNVENCS